LGKKPFAALLVIAVLLTGLGSVCGWSNGGYSSNPAQPKYGTHDWIAQHALDYLPTQEKQYLTANLQGYLYGTELPDNRAASDGIGDTTKHHIYFNADGSLKDDAAAQRARDEYNKALSFLKNKDYSDAAKEAGTLSHYIDDLAVFGHVMGASTAWGAEVHHDDYETHVNSETASYNSSFVSLSFDGNLTIVSAYNAAVSLAYDTTFGGASGLTCVWMDSNYNWDNPTFCGRCNQSLNLAVNAVADVLHTLYVEADSPTSSPTATAASSPVTPEFPAVQPVVFILLMLLATAVVYRVKFQKINKI
jgi:hypothetical protein